MPTCFKDNSLLLGLKANLFLKIQEIKKNQSQLFLYFAFFVWLDVSFQVALLGYLSYSQNLDYLNVQTTNIQTQPLCS